MFFLKGEQLLIRHTAIKSAAAVTPTIHQPPSQQPADGVPRASVFVYLKNLFNNTSEVSMEPAPRLSSHSSGGDINSLPVFVWMEDTCLKNSVKTTFLHHTDKTLPCYTDNYKTPNLQICGGALYTCIYK